MLATDCGIIERALSDFKNFIYLSGSILKLHWNRWK